MTDVFDGPRNTAPMGTPIPILRPEPSPAGRHIEIGGPDVGEAVAKSNGYPFPGVVVAVFDTLSGARRYVVERVGPNEEPEGLLHIYNAGQLEPRTPAAEGVVTLSVSAEDAERVKAFLSADTPRHRGGSALRPLTKEENEIMDEVSKHRQPLTGYVMTGTCERVATLLAVDEDVVRNTIKKARYREDPRAGVQRKRAKA